MPGPGDEGKRTDLFFDLFLFADTASNFSSVSAVIRSTISGMCVAAIHRKSESGSTLTSVPTFVPILTIYCRSSGRIESHTVE